MREWFQLYLIELICIAVFFLSYFRELCSSSCFGGYKCSSGLAYFGSHRCCASFLALVAQNFLSVIAILELAEKIT